MTGARGSTPGGIGTNQVGVRRHNLGVVLDLVHRSGGLSRAELTRRMGLNRSTIAALVTELEQSGLVRQVAPTGSQSGVGRPSRNVRVTEGRAYVLAAEVQVDGLIVARVGLSGLVESRASAAPLRDPEDVATALAGLFGLVVQDAPAGAALVGVGVGVPGTVDARDGAVRFAPNLGWHDVPFGEILAGHLGDVRAPRVGNDADLGAYAEHRLGAGVGVDDLVYISGNVGIGGGLIVGGRGLSGAGGLAGEIGHMVIDLDGPVCRCGSVGCWETFIGAEAIARATGLDSGDLDRLDDHLDAGVPPGPALDRVGRALGHGLGSVVNIFNPAQILLGGYLRSVYPAVRDEVQSAFMQSSLAANRHEVRLALPGLGGDSVLLGAAELALGGLFDDPLGTLNAAPMSLPA